MRSAIRRRAFCLSVRGFVRLSIHQALALGAAKQGFGALYIANPEGGTGVVPEVKFAQVAMQMGFADMVKRAEDAALQNGEMALNGVRVNIVADVLANGMIDAGVTGELRAD